MAGPKAVPRALPNILVTGRCHDARLAGGSRLITRFVCSPHRRTSHRRPLSRSYRSRTHPGTPGCGKTSLCEALASAIGFTHIEVNGIIKAKSLHSGKDESFDSLIIDEEAEDKICDELEPALGAAAGGQLVDYHSVAFFPERWFDLVVVLRADTAVLYDRLQARSYSQKKVSENVECEIMQVVLESVRESYRAEIIKEVQSNTTEDMDSNVDSITAWVDACRR